MWVCRRVKVRETEQDKLATIERQREQCLSVLENMRAASRQAHTALAGAKAAAQHLLCEGDTVEYGGVWGGGGVHALRGYTRYAVDGSV